MDVDTWQRAKQLIAEALDRPAPEREAFVRERCPDSDLFREIRELLANVESLGGFLEPAGQQSLQRGALVGRYEIVSLVGRGGMGEVYRARDPRLRREVAVKIMRVSARHDPNLVERFEQEARAAATLNHPNILAVHDVGVHDGQPYIVSELLDGVTLRQIIEHGLPIDRAVQYAIEMCRGLAAAHDRGIVHRDLKPENLLVSRDGHVKIVDFGLAKLIEGPAGSSRATGSATSAALTTANTIMGTLGYMSPEQLTGKTVDHRSDVFAVGAILYELVSGRRAFTGDSPAEIVAAVLNGEPAPLAGDNPIAAAASTLTRHCFERDPSQRFQSARDLATALEAILSAGRVTGGARTQAPAASAADTTGAHRLIVLPFDNLSRAEDDEWLAAALADSLTFGLRNVENLIIVNRQHAGASTDPRQLFEALAVRYCVRGSYHRVGDDLKVLVRLVHADTGSIALQESLTDRFSNLLSIEDTIAERFASALEQARVDRTPRRTSSLAAYKRLSQARELQLTGRYEEASRHLEIAVRQDPSYAEAWALLANSYARLTSPATSDDTARTEFQRRALPTAERAAELDPSLYEAQIALALAYRGMEDVERWRTAALKASELNPRMAEAYVLLGQSYFAAPAWGFTRHRDRDLAERYLRKALQLDPRFGLGHNALIYHRLWDGRPTDALRAADDAVGALPDHVDLLRARAMTLVQLGRVNEAEDHLAQLATESTNSVQDEWALAAIDLLRGRLQRAAARFDAVIARGPRLSREIDTTRLYCQIGDFMTAAAHLRAACTADPACARFVEQCQAFAEYRGADAIAAALRV